jgi:uncharacterized protein (TIGR02118 family)
MIKLLFFCRRRPEITHERYSERLLARHVPLALRHHPTLRRYVVNLVEHSPPDAAPLDSIGELHFDTLFDYRERLYDSPEGRAIVERDVAEFLKDADAHATTEHVHKAQHPAMLPGLASPGVKLVCPVRRHPALTHEQFARHWLERHVPLALAYHPGLSKYVTNVVDARLSDTGPGWDGIAELQFASEDDWRAHMYDSPAGEQVIRADVARFIAHGVAYRVREYVQRA